MPDYFQDMDFPRYSLHVRLVLYLVFLQNFYSHLLSSDEVGAEAHLAKGTLSESTTCEIKKELIELYLCTYQLLLHVLVDALLVGEECSNA